MDPDQTAQSDLDSHCLSMRLQIVNDKNILFVIMRFKG